MSLMSLSSGLEVEVVAVPELTVEQRRAALEKAAHIRRERAAVKNRLKNSGASLTETLHSGLHDEASAR